MSELRALGYECATYRDQDSPRPASTNAMVTSVACTPRPGVLLGQSRNLLDESAGRCSVNGRSIWFCQIPRSTTGFSLAG
jgi:hypothetical protein